MKVLGAVTKLTEGDYPGALEIDEEGRPVRRPEPMDGRGRVSVATKGEYFGAVELDENGSPVRRPQQD